MKKLSLIISLLFLGAGLFSKEKPELKLGLLNGPSCLPVAKLLEDKDECKIYNTEHEIYSAPNFLIPKLIKNEADIGFLPLNAAAKIYNSSEKILCCAVTGKGNLALITKDPSIKKLSDLKGKTVSIAGSGATPEYMMKYLTEKEGLKPDKDVIFDYSIPSNLLAASLIEDKIKYAVLPEPFVTIALMKNNEVFCAVDLQNEYEKKSGNENYPLTVMVVTKSFAQKYPEIVKAFLSDYQASLEWTCENPKEAGILGEKLGLGLNAAAAEKSIPKSNYTLMPSGEKATEIACRNLLEIFLENDSSSIGGKLPDSGFYLK